MEINPKSEDRRFSEDELLTQQQTRNFLERLQFNDKPLSSFFCICTCEKVKLRNEKENCRCTNEAF